MRLSKEAKAMVFKYKLTMQQYESYMGSVFCNPGSGREKAMDAVMSDLATRFKEKTGESIDKYTWKV
jgi:hypothetical protein